MKITPYSDEEISLLKKHYPISGTKELKHLINRPPKSIRNQAFYLKIGTKAFQPVNSIYIQNFLNITKPEVAFFLGYFWADGHISDKNNNIMIGIAEKDGMDMKDIFLSVIPFGISISRPVSRPNSQKTMTFQKTNKEIRDFLKQYKYNVKSNDSPTEILNVIPEHLRHFWWQGYFNGDGCLYLNRSNKNIHPRVSFVGPVDQDWKFYQELCGKLQIRVNLSKRQNKFGKWSKVYIQTITECRSFLDYIYKNGNIGLKRKFNLYLELKDSINIPKPKTSKFKGVSFCNTRKCWRAFVTINGKFVDLGGFDSEDKAVIARDKFVRDNKLPFRINLI